MYSTSEPCPIISIHSSDTQVMARQSRSSNKGVPLGPLDVLYTTYTHTTDIVLYHTHKRSAILGRTFIVYGL